MVLGYIAGGALKGIGEHALQKGLEAREERRLLKQQQFAAGEAEKAHTRALELEGVRHSNKIVKDKHGRNRKAKTGEAIFSDETLGPAPVDVDKDLKIIKDYKGSHEVKTYKKIRDSYERVRSSSKLDTGAGDIALIFNYMKMLDPGSVVRENEFATAEQAGGVGEYVLNIYNRVVGGERLSPEMRKEFVDASRVLYANTSRNLEDINKTYERNAGRWGVDVDTFIIRPETYDSPGDDRPTSYRDFF